MTNKPIENLLEEALVHDNNSWEKCRDAKNYDMKITHIEAINDKRYVLYRKSSDDNLYEMLQCSRGITFNKESQDLIKDVNDNQMILQESDEVRIDEINEFFKSKETQVGNLNTFIEIGFRVPKLLKYYRELGFEKVVGYDVVNLNVSIGKALGYDTYVQDFNNLINCTFPELEFADLVVSYHMLEHVSRPDEAVKKIYEKMKKGSYFHVEIPVEPGVPRLRYGHLFPFHPMDMYKILRFVGFQIISATNKTHTNGPHIERYICTK